MTRSIARVALAFAAVLTGLPALPASADLPTLIPRSVLFGPPVRTAAQISPDGRYLAFLAPADGKLAIWVRTLGSTDDRMVAADAKRPIRSYFWQADSKHVLYSQDLGGDENFHVFQTDVASRESKDLTPFPGVRASVSATDETQPDVALVSMNKRDKRVFDEYLLNLRTGTTTLVAENPGDYQGFIPDNHLHVRAAQQASPDGTARVLVRAGDSGPFKMLTTTAPDDGFPQPQGFSPDGKTMYVITSSNANAARLLAFDIGSGTSTVIAADPNYDVAGAIFDPVSKQLIGSVVLRDRADVTLTDARWRDEYAAIQKIHRGDVGYSSFTRDGKKMILSFSADDSPPTYYLYDRATKSATLLFSTRPDLDKFTLSKMQPITYPARDGMTIHGYLTVPTGVEAKNLPMVLLVHGGPWARDNWGYNSTVQWLANRGYAVLQPNFRSSTGYGKTFLNAGDRQWAGTMRTDLLDAVAWAVAQGYADPKRVAIEGGSYGGYATLTALAYSPTTFAAGVDIVGPSNLNTLLASIPPYWETAKSQFTRRMGDTEAFLNSQSPLFKADQMVAPLLIGQGANDPRVNQRESDQIAAAMRKNGKPVQYIVFPDEGHGFANPANNLRFNAATEAFLAKYIGGRAEPATAAEAIGAFEK